MEQSTVDNNNLDLQKEIEKVNKYKYDQSSKGSELIRKIVFAIIGSCWVMIFANGDYQEINIFLKVTIVCSFIYLLLDVMHYFLDTCSYHRHAQKMEQGVTWNYVEKIFKPADLHISQRSFIFFILKVIVCFIVSCTFLTGVFMEFVL